MLTPIGAVVRFFHLFVGTALWGILLVLVEAGTAGDLRHMAMPLFRDPPKLVVFLWLPFKTTNKGATSSAGICICTISLPFLVWKASSLLVFRRRT